MKRDAFPKVLLRSFAMIGIFLGIGCPLLCSDDFSEDEIANTFSAREVDVIPSALKQDQPVVPGNVKGISGKVFVGFIVDARGRVIAPRVIKSDNERLDEIALDCVFGWEFKPAQKEGTNVSVRVIVPLRF
jgi:TonB family protein